MRIIARIFWVVLLLSLPFMQTLFAGQPKETKRVLVLYSEDKAHPAHELTDQGIRSASVRTRCSKSSCTRSI